MTDRTAIVDIDGVLADFAGGMALTLGEKFADTEGYHFWRKWGWSDEAYWAEFKRWRRGGGFRGLSPLGRREHVADDLEALIDAGFVVLFLTSRDPEAHDDSEAWLRWLITGQMQGDGLPSGYMLRHVGEAESKAALLGEISGEVAIIDDAPDELAAYAARVAEGTGWDVARLSYPYNDQSPGVAYLTFSEWVSDTLTMPRHAETPSAALEESEAQLPSESGGAPENVRQRILRGAEHLVTGDRNNQYGPPSQDFSRTAAILSALFDHKLVDGQRFEAHEVALMVMAVKMSRLAWDPFKADSWMDLAGYGSCGAEAVELLGELKWE